MSNGHAERSLKRPNDASILHPPPPPAVHNKRGGGGGGSVCPCSAECFAQEIPKATPFMPKSSNRKRKSILLRLSDSCWRTKYSCVCLLTFLNVSMQDEERPNQMQLYVCGILVDEAFRNLCIDHSLLHQHQNQPKRRTESTTAFEIVFVAERMVCRYTCMRVSKFVTAAVSISFASQH